LDLSRNHIDAEGIRFVLDAMLGNYSIVKLQYDDNPFFERDECREEIARLTDVVERNNYYLHNILMQDMAALVADPFLL
jgi:hypothetical protein